MTTCRVYVDRASSGHWRSSQARSTIVAGRYARHRCQAAFRRITRQRCSCKGASLPRRVDAPCDRLPNCPVAPFVCALDSLIDPIVPAWTAELYYEDCRLHHVPTKMVMQADALHQWINTGGARVVPKVQRLGTGTVTRVARSAVAANISAQPQCKVACRAARQVVSMPSYILAHRTAATQLEQALAHRDCKYDVASLAIVLRL